MNNKDLNYFMEALCSDAEDIDHPVPANTDSGVRDFNWLDAAPKGKVAEFADMVIVFCARLLLIRTIARQEEHFSIGGYSGILPVEPDPVPGHVFQDVEQHVMFYLKLQRRLAYLKSLESMNRSPAAIRFPEADSAGISEGKPERDLYEEYEFLRRSNIDSWHPLASWPGGISKDFLTTATPKQLKEPADEIMVASAARMAARSSLRLIKAWKGQRATFSTGKIRESPPLPLMFEERGRYVDLYLGIREALAETANKLAMAERAGEQGLCRPGHPASLAQEAAM